ncbi:MAG: hypothetical protein AB1758_21970, partial [Candidatus Eremiobacterota bacterium]
MRISSFKPTLPWTAPARAVQTPSTPLDSCALSGAATLPVADASALAASCLGGPTGAALVVALLEKGLHFREDRGFLRMPFSPRLRP